MDLLAAINLQVVLQLTMLGAVVVAGPIVVLLVAVRSNAT